MPLIECAYLGALPVDAFKIVFRISESDYEMRSVEVLGRSEKRCYHLRHSEANPASKFNAPR
jgi:hypothetical protein